MFQHIPPSDMHHPPQGSAMAVPMHPTNSSAPSGGGGNSRLSGTSVPADNSSRRLSMGSGKPPGRGGGTLLDLYRQRRSIDIADLHGTRRGDSAGVACEGTAAAECNNNERLSSHRSSSASLPPTGRTSSRTSSSLNAVNELEEQRGGETELRHRRGPGHERKWRADEGLHAVAAPGSSSRAYYPSATAASGSGSGSGSAADHPELPSEYCF